MAEQDKSQQTEAPSSRRLRRAREQGQAPLSKEAVAFGTLGAAGIGMVTLLPAALQEGLLALRGVLARSHALAAPEVAGGLLSLFLWTCLPVIGCAALGAVVATMLQTRGLVVLNLLIPRFSRLNPMAAAKRLFGGEQLAETGRNILKLLIVAAAIGFIAGDIAGLNASLQMDGARLLGGIGSASRSLLLVALGAFALLAAADVLLTRRRYLRQLRMSRQDVKEEMKESEGDPMVRARLRQLRETMGRQRMMAAVPTATVVITNPTHYAVALRYVPKESAAPRVVAKGVDRVAERIREAAREAGVPLLPNPPLARALWKLDVDTEIPPEHWEAVAEIIAFIMRPRGAQAPP